MLHIRKQVLKMSQAEMAALTETSQATVSRWETGELEPDRAQMETIREAAKQRGLAWDDAWFFIKDASALAPATEHAA